MRIVFAHDVVLEKDAENGLFYSETFNYTLWQRYLTVFEHITVVSRMRELSRGVKKDQAALCNGPSVSFAPVPSISNPVAMITRRTEAANILTAAIAGADAVIARLHSEVGLLAIEIAERMNKPWAVEVVAHAWDCLWNYGNLQGKIYAPISTWRTKQIVRKAPYALYVTQQFLQKHYPSKGRTIGCSDVEIQPISNNILQQRLRKIDNKQAPFKIGLIGSMAARYKGIDTALKALIKIRDKLPPFEFRILGGGNARPWQQMADNLGLNDVVKFCGTLPSGAPVQSWLDELDLYIQPSLTEGMPRALIEAMSRGLPVFGSTAGGIPELLDHSCLFDPGDHIRLSELILQAFQDKNWRREISQQSICKASKYTKQAIDTQRNAFWREFSDYALNH